MNTDDNPHSMPSKRICYASSARWSSRTRPQQKQRPQGVVDHDEPGTPLPRWWWLSSSPLS